MDYTKYIIESKLILIPVLYVLGAIIKQSTYIQDKYIPLVVLVVSVALSIADTGIGLESIIQGILVAGATVFTNQLFKQFGKGD